MNNFEEIKTDIINQLNKTTYKGDLSDIGNEIGIILGKYISENKDGYNLGDFIFGLKHGISLTNGTHG
jgi:hypothetical protein